MFAYIKGQFVYKTPTDLHIETKDGVAYHLHISVNTYSKIEEAEQGRLYTYLHVREDDMKLYGFNDLEEKDLFLHLISVSGIGTNTARIILSSMTPIEVRTAIVTENDLAFKKVKGVGPKTAKRLILDLKDKLRKTSADDLQQLIPGTSSAQEEAIQALTALGFTRQKIMIVFKKIDTSQQAGVEQLVKAALKILT